MWCHDSESGENGKACFDDEGWMEATFLENPLLTRPNIGVLQIGYTPGVIG